MAFTVLKNVSQDELNWYHETRYWMHVSDEVTMINGAIREGHAKGLAEGEHKKAVEAARNAFSLGLTPQQISQITELPLEEVQKLADT